MTESAGHTYAARCSLQPVTLCAFLTFSVLAVAFHSQRWCRACALTADETSWADPWMRDWIAEQEAKQDVPELSSVPKGSLGVCPKHGKQCHIKKWLPHQVLPAQRQLVPYVMWQTWKDTTPLRKRYAGISSMPQVNPEYDYVLFTDEDCERFMRELADPDVLRAYEVLVPKAGKADIWRLAIIYRYGGIYADSDVKALYAFRSYIWPNASVVTGLGSKKDFHQWLLIYTPRHPFIREALKAVSAAVLKHYEEHTAGNIEYMTGPHNYHPHGVAVVLKRNNCTTLPDQAEEEGLQLVREGHPCEKTQEPEPIGVVQVYDSDWFNGGVEFKVEGLRQEMDNSGEVRYTEYKTWETMFRAPESHEIAGR